MRSADDILEASNLDDLIIWWKNIISEDKKYIFQYRFKLTTDGQRHLRAAIGTSNFCAQYAAEKVTKWCNDLHRLADFAKTQPHAAYSAFTYSILSQYTYFMRTIPGMHEFIKPVDDVVRLELLPASSNPIVPEVDRQLYSPLLRHGELGIPILSEITNLNMKHRKL